MPEFVPRVVEMHAYPIKGARPGTIDGGEEPTTLLATREGFNLGGVGDREVFPVDASAEPYVITARGWKSAQGPKVEYRQDAQLAAVLVDVLPGRRLRVDHFDVGSLEFALDVTPRAQKLQSAELVALHGGYVYGVPLPKTTEFASTLLGRPATFYQALGGLPRTAGGKDHLESRQALAADGYAYLLTNPKSLEALHAAAEQRQKPGQEEPDVPMRRYRPNLVVDLGEPFVEHRLRQLKIGDVMFDVPCACARCRMTNINEQGVDVGGGLALLRPNSGVKMDENGQPGEAGAFFGVNLTTANLGPGEERPISFSSPVQVLEASDKSNIRLKGEA